MPKIQLTTGIGFTSEPGSTLLDAASAAGVQLPYSCKTGRCGTCKCKVLDGETVALSAELGLSATEMTSGWILSCIRTAVSDVTISVELLDGVNLPIPRTWPCRISSIRHLAPDVLGLHLRLPPAHTFTYLPGQYIDLIGPNGLRRSYSLAATIPPMEPLELHIRAVPGGVMSEHLFQHAKPNDLLRLHGPLGTFFLRDINDRDLYFLATGTGIAPVKAMLESLPSNSMQPRSVTVLWGGRQLVDLYLNMQPLADSYTFIPVLSQENSEWGGARGHVQDVLLARQSDLSNATVYACGSDAMIHSSRTALIQAGLPEHHFHSDAFVCSSPSITPES